MQVNGSSSGRDVNGMSWDMVPLSFVIMLYVSTYVIWPRASNHVIKSEIRHKNSLTVRIYYVTRGFYYVILLLLV